MSALSARTRLLLAVVAALVLVLATAGAIALVGGPGASPSVSPSGSIRPTATPAPTDPGATPESAVRSFVAAVAEARKTDDPTIIRPFVTNTDATAYLSVEAFLRGQKETGKASILTVQKIGNLAVDVTGDTATVRFAYTEGGYNISLNSGEPLETPNVLAPRNVTATVHRVSGHWLVDDYLAVPQ